MTKVHTIEGNFLVPVRDSNFRFEESLMLISKELRSEPLYDKDIFAEKTALNYIKTILEFFEGNVYLLKVSYEALARKVRTKKWEIEQRKAFCGLEYHLGEYSVYGNKTQLTCLVDLNGFDYDATEEFTLPYVYSLIILSTVKIDILDNLIGNWLPRTKKPSLLFDYKMIAEDLLSLNTTAILRYFPADNGKNEEVVVLGNKHFVENNIRPGVDAIKL